MSESELRARLTEATALLERCYRDNGWQDIKDFLSSRAPAQPAAPTPDLCLVCGSSDIDHGAEHMGAVEFPDSLCEACYRRGTSSAPKEPAAPEPSSEDSEPECDNCSHVMDGYDAATSDVCFDCWRSHKDRADSAEAQLTAVRLVVSRLRSAFGPVNYAVVIDKLEYLLTAPSPGAGEQPPLDRWRDGATSYTPGRGCK